MFLSQNSLLQITTPHDMYNYLRIQNKKIIHCCPIDIKQYVEKYNLQEDKYIGNKYCGIYFFKGESRTYVYNNKHLKTDIVKYDVIKNQRSSTQCDFCSYDKIYNIHIEIGSLNESFDGVIKSYDVVIECLTNLIQQWYNIIISTGNTITTLKTSNYRKIENDIAEFDDNFCELYNRLL